ncbi:segregation and condensation protein A [Companilactobacillus zhachilii]|uniref:segregation and condensation protein A n=1 Tax=Companilactobacillus zhachilii TaxID=2304606 RepID=UPI00192110FE|nr:segregation/condensation protein A [Companilactobacillus zhachilii]MBL3530163.1 segregation/condensation protein A [Companilactobacillus zhachilii]
MQKLNLVLTDFEGPIDLLLHLIKESKVDIYDIPIAQITQQYIDYLNSMKVLQLDIAGDYLVMASTLMSIKSKMLLPQAPDEIDDEFEADDPRDELVSQLLTYQTYKRVAAYFEEKEQVRKQQFDKEVSLPTTQLEQFLEPGSVVLDDLASTYAELLREKKNRQPETETIENETLSIEDATNNIMSELKTVKRTTFKALLKLHDNIEEIVTDFMAILELASKQLVIVQQADFKSELFIELRN